MTNPCVPPSLEEDESEDKARSRWVSLAAKRESVSSRELAGFAGTRKPSTSVLTTLAIIDANAILKNESRKLSEDLFQELCTTEEVLNEIKDKRAKAVLQGDTNWQRMTCARADEEDVEKVKAFARKTGDLGALSEADVRVIALALTMEKRRNGGSLLHLRTEPMEVRKYRRRASKASQPMPGWDFVSNEDDWKELDEMNEEAERNMPKLVGEDLVEKFAKMELEKQELLNRGMEAKNATIVVEELFPLCFKEMSVVEEVLEDAGEEEKERAGEEDEWEPAISRTTRVRRMKREQRNKEREEEIELEKIRLKQNGSEDEKEDEMKTGGEKKGVSFFESDPGEIPDEDDDENDENYEKNENENDDDEKKRQESKVSIVTADYAMQNVILQMGLKLYTPDGMRVKEVRRWVMRRHACETVTLNTQRVFCPKCGNNALERVEKFVGADGAEHYGVRSKHVLKGTKYSIPMPKQGRLGKKLEPILREDQLIGRKITKKEREMNNITKQTSEIFNCEFSEDKYGEYKSIETAQKTIISIGGGNAKKNPNERKHIATNRRRK
jgi:RNA-binding protein NOB1